MLLGMVEETMWRDELCFFFLEMRKTHGKEASYSRWQVFGIREPSWTAERQGFEIQMVSLHAISRKDDALASDLFQTIVH